MPFLVDGNNLMFALRKAGVDAGRQKICTLLAALAKTANTSVAVVFDGPKPPPAVLRQMEYPAIEIAFSELAKADELIVARIKANSAPRRLVVVSSDHEIRIPAQHRRCQVIRSEDFVPLLLEAVNPPPQRPREPREKYQGLTDDEAKKWIKEFGLDDEEETGREPR